MGDLWWTVRGPILEGMKIFGFVVGIALLAATGAATFIGAMLTFRAIGVWLGLPV